MSSRRTKSTKPRQGGNAGGRDSASSSAVSKGKKNAELKSAAKGVTSTAGSGRAASDDSPHNAAYLISCDIPTKQFIQYLDELKPVDKKFIIQDLDAKHLLVKLSCRHEIEKKVENWLNENVFSAIEKCGEDFDVS